MLWQRVTTAVLLLPAIILGVIYSNDWQFTAAWTAIMLYAAFEWSSLLQWQNIVARLSYVATIGLAFWLTKYLSFDAILIAALFAWVLIAVWELTYPNSNKIWGPTVVRFVIGIFVLVPSWYAINQLHSWQHGAAWLLTLLILIWCADTGAYFAGHWFGKHKLAPKLSPGKTFAGIYGGLGLALLFAIAAAWYWPIAMQHWRSWLIMCAMTVVLSVVGDLCVSMLKRYAGLKDTGHLLPGHGGVLDRFDSLTAAAPLFVFVLHYLPLL